MLLTENTGRKKSKNSPSGHHCTTLSGYIFATKGLIDNWKKKLVKQQYLLYMSSQYGKRWPTNGWDWFTNLGHPSTFQRFHVLASLLQHRRSSEANQTLHDVWPSPGLLHYIYIYIDFRGILPPNRIWPVAKFTLCPSLTFSYVGNVTAQHSSSRRQPNFAAWYKEWNYRNLAEDATYIRLGGHHVGHWPTF